MTKYTLGLALAALASTGYTAGSFFLKSALSRGATASQVNLTVNLGVALCVLPLWGFDNPAIPNAPPLLPILAALTFFIGQVFTFTALAVGDVSIATPVVGTKVLIVTILNAILFSIPIPGKWWIAAAAASLGTAVIASGTRRGERKNAARTALLSMGAAFFFSLTDVLVQHWAGAMDALIFLPAMFSGVALMSTAWYAIADRSAFDLRGTFLPPLLAGVVLLGIQCGMVFLALAFSADATAVNVVYGLRSLLSVLCAWAFGAWFGFREATVGRRIMLQRAAGAGLLFGAIALILLR